MGKVFSAYNVLTYTPSTRCAHGKGGGTAFFSNSNEPSIHSISLSSIPTFFPVKGSSILPTENIFNHGQKQEVFSHKDTTYLRFKLNVPSSGKALYFAFSIEPTRAVYISFSPFWWDPNIFCLSYLTARYRGGNIHL